MSRSAMLSRFLWFLPPGRRVHVLPDDTFLVSYPKSGSVWTRFLLATLVNRRPLDFPAMNALFPDIYVASRKHLSRLARPRLMKSHEYFDPRYRRVIYLVRDPRDVVTSYYEYQNKKKMIPENYSLEGYVERFVDGGLDPFGTWREHVGSWLGARLGDPSFLLVRYEDLKNATVPELQRIADFIGLEANDGALTAAVEQCSFTKMRKLEQVQAKEGIIDRSRFDRPALRTGRAGGWREQLGPVLAARITEAFRAEMADLGYVDASASRQSQALERRVQDAAP